jgi:mannose/fructose/N-acetylgalactosamine-specific phosphotransferase system component IIC
VIAMAETVTIEGQSYLKRNPLGVLGLTVITLGIYFLYWFWKINDELRLYKRDESISPTRSLMAMLVGWLIIVPPFIAMYNTSKHVQDAEQRLGVQPQLEPALTIVFLLIVAIGNTIYVQEHLNRIWDRASVSKESPTSGASGLPMPPAP